MSGWIPDTISRWVVSLAAWTQNRYFEPKHYQAPWVVYSHDGTIDLCDTAPVLAPTHALWQRVSNTEQYTRVDIPIISHEAPTSLPMPIIQVVVRLNSHGRIQRRSKANPRDFDITNEISTFGGYPKLDWMHVGLCVKHRYDVEVYPGQYTLSIIDGECNLIELDEVSAAVFSVAPPLTSPSSPSSSPSPSSPSSPSTSSPSTSSPSTSSPPTSSPSTSSPPISSPPPTPLANVIPTPVASEQQEDTDDEPEPLDYESDIDNLDDDLYGDSDPEPDAEE